MRLEGVSRSPLLHLSQVIFRKGRPWWFATLLWFVLIAPAQAALELRVAIEEGVQQLKVGSSTTAVVRDGSNRVLGELAGMNSFNAQLNAGRVKLHNQWQAGQLWIEPKDGGYVWIGDRWYRGRTLLVPTRSGLTAVNYVNLEQYLYSVVGSEMPASWPLEALKAQAVSARSYALYQRQNDANGVYDMGDTQGWQVYKGIEAETTSTQSAVDGTTGQVLTYGGRIIEAVFHSSSGGHTENVEEVWVQALPYLRGVPDFDQQFSPHTSWTKTFSREELSNRISGVGTVVRLEPEKLTANGRIRAMRVEGSDGKRTISGEALRNALGLKSTWFSVTPQFTAAGNKSGGSLPDSFTVSGRGFGHGLGMSQWGAYGMAAQGRNYQQIVQHYYQGATLAKVQIQ